MFFVDLEKGENDNERKDKNFVNEIIGFRIEIIIVNKLDSLWIIHFSRFPI